jgi:penicillin-binding protein 1A
LPEKPAIALGSADLTLWELLGAYTAFANEGVKTDLLFINSISNVHGETLYTSKVKQKRILSTEVAQDITNMMRDVVNKGTAYELRENYKFTGDMAGKTGTTQDHRDGWYVGYTSRMLAGVWVGADNPAIHFSNMEQGKGSRMAMPIWAGFYRRVLRDPKVRYLAANFSFENDIDCEMKKEDGFFEKLFRRKNKTSKSTGFEKEEEGSSDEKPQKKKKKFNWFRKKE